MPIARVAEEASAGPRKGRTLRGARPRRDRADRSAARRLRHPHRRRAAPRAAARRATRWSSSAPPTGPPPGAIVFEAKDKKLSKNEAWAELNEAMAARAASFAVLVVAGEERVPVRARAAARVRGQQADRRGRPRGARRPRARGRLPARRGPSGDGPRLRPRGGCRRGPRHRGRGDLAAQAGAGDPLDPHRDQDQLGQGARRPRRDGRGARGEARPGSTRWSPRPRPRPSSPTGAAARSWSSRAPGRP